MLREKAVVEVGFDGLTLKPTEVDLASATGLDVELLTVDFEGKEHVPDVAALERLAETFDLRVTTPVRANGFDPLGPDERFRSLPESAEPILVAGHPSYLSASERARAIAPRLQAAAKRSEDHWVGTEGIERLALAVGGTQYELLSATTRRDVSALRAAGCEEEVAVYAPTVLSDDPDEILDAVGDYVARRGPVAASLPEDAPADSRASGTAREFLLEAAREYALVGEAEAVAERIDGLREAGVDVVVGYPARGL